MGNTLTRSSGEEADLPSPPTRRHSTRSRRSSQFAEWARFDEHPPRTTLRALSGMNENRPRRRRRRTNPLQETDGNARQAASTAWTTDEKRRNQGSQPSRYRHRRSQAEVFVHRNHKAESHPAPPRARLSAEGKTSTRAPYRSNSPRRSRSSRKSKGDLKKNAIHIEVSEVKEKPAKRECVICTETRPLYRFPKCSPTTACTHEISTCRHCLRKWIQSSFKTKLWDQINCPECNARLQYDDVQAFAPAAIFKRYDELATRAALEAIPGFQWCIARGCKSGQVHEQGDAMPRFKCSSCKASHCVVHGVLWHKGETCAEFDYRTDGKQKKAEEAASKKWIKKTAKKCPTCNSNIEKVSGCDHMKCLKCRHEFCWLCMADFEAIRKQGNEMHRPDCEHYDDGTRVWV